MLKPWSEAYDYSSPASEPRLLEFINGSKFSTKVIMRVMKFVELIASGEILEHIVLEDIDFGGDLVLCRVTNTKEGSING